jgi:hypothetical protein
MTRSKIALLCVPLALTGLGLTLHATFRVNGLSSELATLGAAGRAEGQSFVETLQGEHAERQRVTYDRRRAIALSLAAARRDRLLGLVLTAAAGLAGAALSVMARIAAEVEEDRRHVRGQTAERRPDRS